MQHNTATVTRQNNSERTERRALRNARETPRIIAINHQIDAMSLLNDSTQLIASGKATIATLTNNLNAARKALKHANGALEYSGKRDRRKGRR